MKKNLLILLGTLIYLPALAQVFEYAYEGQTLTYTVVDEEAKECKVFSNDPVSGNLVIPPIAKNGNNEYTVTLIADGAFAYCELSSLTLPSTLVHIGTDAFWGCNEITSVYYGADDPITAILGTFMPSVYHNATLYMTETGAALGRTICPWSEFDNIVVYEFDGIGAIDANTDTTKPCEIYSISGVMVVDRTEGLAPGVYIVRRGNEAKKIMVK